MIFLPGLNDSKAKYPTSLTPADPVVRDPEPRHRQDVAVQQVVRVQVQVAGDGCRGTEVEGHTGGVGCTRGLALGYSEGGWVAGASIRLGIHEHAVCVAG